MEEKTANMAENIRVTFTGFHYIKDGDYPNDFEVCLLILKDNSLSAGLLYRYGLCKSLDEAGG